MFNTATPATCPIREKFVHFGNSDQARWAKAAATNKQFIDEYGNSENYNLFTDLKNFWRASNEYNPEVKYGTGRSLPTCPAWDGVMKAGGGPTYVLGGRYRSWGNYNPTQELVDLTGFAMANGKPITDPYSRL